MKLKNYRPFIFVLTLFSLLATTSVYAKSKSKSHSFQNLRYPELEVSPLASERLSMEANQEPNRQWTSHWAFQVSSLTTLLSSVVTDADTGSEADHDDAKLAGTLIGGGWLIGSVILSAYYSPYQKGASQVKGLKNKTKRQKITKERMAEESLHAPASLIRRLKWLSWVSNLAASAFIASNASDDTRIYPMVSGLVSFLPLIFNHHWEHVSHQHSVYKKKIYGPVWGTGFIKAPNQKLTPALTLAYRF